MDNNTFPLRFRVFATAKHLLDSGSLYHFAHSEAHNCSTEYVVRKNTHPTHPKFRASARTAAGRRTLGDFRSLAAAIAACNEFDAS